MGLLLIIILSLVPTGKNEGFILSEEDTIDVIVTFTEPLDFGSLFPQADIHYTYQTFNGVSVTVPKGLYSSIVNHPLVKNVELNQKEYALCTQDLLDWGVDQIEAEQVWSGNEDGKDVIFSGQYTGEGIKVAIIDSGIDYTHPDLNDNCKGGYNILDDNETAPMDIIGHGTYSAGIIAAEDNDEGIIGVAPEAELYAVKVVYDNGTIKEDNVAAGIEWAIDNSMDVISISLGYHGYNDAITAACNAAYTSGIVVVAASGNTGFSHVMFPAFLDSVIAVGATDSDNDLWGLSCYGDDLELVAPGVDIYTTSLNGGYVYKDGTSLACPHVSGTIALMLSKDSSLTPTQVREALQDTTLDLNTSGWDQYTGYGLVQADEAFSEINDLVVHADSYITYSPGINKWKMNSYMCIDNGNNAGWDYVKVEYRVGDSGSWNTIREEIRNLSNGENWVTDLNFYSANPSTKIWVQWTVGYHPDTRKEYKLTPRFWP